MKKQTYIIENIRDFEPIHIFECGQCFRWNEQEDGSYTGIFKNNIINVNKVKNDVIFTGICDGDIKDICNEYFDLNRDYEQIKQSLSKIDDNLKESIKYGKGIRILHQNLWETIISFIISANNNIPRIKGIIERMSEKYGNEIEFEGKKYYTFPKPAELANVSIDDFRKLGLGFRDVRIYDTVQKTLKGEINLEKLEKEQDIEKLKEDLLKISGVGPKVADCIMLFSLQKYEVFPVDVWVRRVISELYFKNEEQNPKTIQVFAKNHFGKLAGLAQQYLFYWRRDTA